MLIVGIARTQIERFKKSAQIYTGAQVGADLLQTDGDRCFAMLVMPAFFFVVVIVVMRVHRAGAGGDAVIRVIIADRKADMAAITDIGEAGGRVDRAAGRVGDRSEERRVGKEGRGRGSGR